MKTAKKKVVKKSHTIVHPVLILKAPTPTPPIPKAKVIPHYYYGYSSIISNLADGDYDKQLDYLRKTYSNHVVNSHPLLRLLDENDNGQYPECKFILEFGVLYKSKMYRLRAEIDNTISEDDELTEDFPEIEVEMNKDFLALQKETGKSFIRRMKNIAASIRSCCSSFYQYGSVDLILDDGYAEYQAIPLLAGDAVYHFEKCYVR